MFHIGVTYTQENTPYYNQRCFSQPKHQLIFSRKLLPKLIHTVYFVVKLYQMCYGITSELIVPSSSMQLMLKTIVNLLQTLIRMMKMKME